MSAARAIFMANIYYGANLFKNFHGISNEIC